jgi:hypothetical protein
MKRFEKIETFHGGVMIFLVAGTKRKEPYQAKLAAPKRNAE